MFILSFILYLYCITKYTVYLFPIRYIIPFCDQNICDSILGFAVGIFGFLYFFIYICQILIFYFLSTPDSITDILAVVGFGVGTVLWYTNIIYYQIFCIFQDKNSEKKSSTIWVGFFFFIWTAVFPTIIFLFPDQLLFQFWYILSFTVIIVENLSGYLFYKQSVEDLFSYIILYFVSVDLLVLIPTVYILAEPVSILVQFAIVFVFGQLIIDSFAEWIVYFFCLLERIEVVQNWCPSIYTIYLVWIYSLVSFSNTALETAKFYLY